jgi:hypothetical protein
VFLYIDPLLEMIFAHYLITQITPAEMKAVVAALKGGAGADKIWGEGVHITGEKYVVTKAEDRSIYARKVCIFKLATQSYLMAGHFLTILDTNTQIH